MKPRWKWETWWESRRDTNASAYPGWYVCGFRAKVCQPLAHRFRTTREHVFGLVHVAGLNSKARAICNATRNRPARSVAGGELKIGPYRQYGDRHRDSHGINGAISRPLSHPVIGSSHRAARKGGCGLLINDGNSGIPGCSIRGELCKKSIPQCSFGERATSLEYKTAAETHAARRGGQGCPSGLFAHGGRDRAFAAEVFGRPGVDGG
jgi:hypothetical protein